MALKRAAPSSSTSSDSGTGRYAKLRHSLGKGGMGTVELATRREGRFLRVYAIKRLTDELRASESGRAMFMDEARVAGLLRHPNVVSVLDVGEDDRGPYLVMDYVKGLDLSRMIRGLRQRGQRMPIDVALRILADVAAGLHAAHELRGPRGESLGLVHRDVSPHNVLVDFEGVVRLSDFGVAKAVGQSATTSTGILKGKIGYIAPEALRFEPIDRRSDLFSLGVVGFEMLSGARLFRGESASDVARAVLACEIPDLADTRDDVPPALHELLLQMLASDPTKRPATALEIKRRLEAILREWALDPEHGEPRELSEFLVQAFEEHRAQVETLYASVLAEAERTSSGEVSLGTGDLEVELELSSTSPDPTPAPTVQPRPARRRVAVASVVTLVALVGVAAAIAAASGARDAEPAIEHAAAAPTAAAPAIAEPAIAEPVEVAAPPVAAEVAVTDVAEPAAVAPATAVEPVAPHPQSTRLHSHGHGDRHRPQPGEAAPAEPPHGALEGLWLPEQR